LPAKGCDTKYLSVSLKGKMDISIDDKFREWTEAGNSIDVVVNIYHKIREIPYAIIPELNDSQKYVEIIKIKRGSCTPKHFLLCNMYQRLGIFVLYAVYPYRWDQVEIDYPPRLKRLAKEMPTSHHLSCRVDIGGQLILVDATVDTELKVLGLPVNDGWKGVGDTLLPIVPCDEEQLYYPSEAELMQPSYDSKSLMFYTELNQWLDSIRKRRK
jgi:hypothetical protein